MSTSPPLGSLAAAFGFTVRVVGLALLGYAALMFVLQRRVVFPGTSREVSRSAAAEPAGVTRVWLELPFGRVEAWYLDARGEGARPAVVFAHGNGELIDDWRDAMEGLRAQGIGALLVEFPGYGLSDGRPSRATLRETFHAAYDWLSEQEGVDRSRIVAYGRSVGGGPAADLALDRPVAALVLQSTFTSTVAMARAMLLPGFLVRDRFDVRGAVSTFPGPVLLMHGRDDDVIPFSHAEGLASAREGLEVHVLDCAHNDCASAWPDIMATLTGFLRAQGLMGDERPAAGSA